MAGFSSAETTKTWLRKKKIMLTAALSPRVESPSKCAGRAMTRALSPHASAGSGSVWHQSTCCWGVGGEFVKRERERERKNLNKFIRVGSQVRRVKMFCALSARRAGQQTWPIRRTRPFRLAASHAFCASPI